MRRGVLAAAAIALLALVVACGGSGTSGDAVPGGDAARGQQELESFGCGGCHQIPGIEHADGRVGPDLSGIRRRLYIAGSLPVTPDNVARWISDPKSVSPGTLMPDLGVTPPLARDMTAYLYDH